MDVPAQCRGRNQNREHLMFVSEDCLPAHWSYYLKCSREADSGRADDFGFGREEQLLATLETIESGVSFDINTQGRLNRISWNRAKKHRRLRKCLSSSPTPSLSGDSPQVKAAMISDTLANVRRLFSEAEWSVESRLARGDTYSEIASFDPTKANALKVRVMRWRTRIRLTCTGRSC